MVRKYEKLVRDRITEIIKENGSEPVTRTVSGDEYANYLIDKLEEEVEEYRENREVEELVDIFEVAHALRKNRGISLEQLENKREEKAVQRGRFEDGIILEEVN